MLLDLVRSTRPFRIRLKAITSIRNIGDKSQEVLSLLRSIIQDHHKEKPIVSANIWDNDSDIRLEALISLGRLGSKDDYPSVQLLKQLANEPKSSLQDMSFIFLGNWGIQDKDIVDRLLKILKEDLRKEYRLEAAKALKHSELKIPEIISALQYSLDTDQSSEVKAIVSEVLFDISNVK